MDSDGVDVSKTPAGGIAACGARREVASMPRDGAPREPACRETACAAPPPILAPPGTERG